jgi:hypothetical protein
MLATFDVCVFCVLCACACAAAAVALQPAEYIKFGHVSEKTDGYAFGIMVVEMLANIDCRQASALVDEHELNTLPQALKELADAGGWPAIISDVLSKVATTCTRGTKTRTTPAEVLQQVEGLWELNQLASAAESGGGSQ